MKKTLTLFIALFLIAPVRSARAAAAGGDPFSFLFLDANARAVALSGAYTAQAVDANALLYNPAGLARIPVHELTFMHNNHFLGSSQDYIGYAGPRGWGMNLNYVSFGDVQKTTFSDPTGAGLGTTSLTDIALGLGRGWELNNAVNLGVGVKYIREAIADFSVNAYAADIGALYQSARLPDLRLGLAVQNIGPTVRFNSQNESLPLNLRAGAAYDMILHSKEHTASLDITKSRTGDLLIAFGVESRYVAQFPIRLGFNTKNAAGPGVTAGIGWAYRSFTFDYAFEPFGDLGLSHLISLTAEWSGGLPLRTKKPGAQTRRRDQENPFDVVDEFIDVGMIDAAQEELEALESYVQSDDLLRIRFHERKGTIAFLRNDNYNAKLEYQNALKIAIQLSLGASAVSDSYAGIGRTLAKEGDYARAVKFMTRALETGPSPSARRRIKDELRKLIKRQNVFKNR